MLDFDTFHRALHSDAGLDAAGVHLPAETLTHLRAHDAYALAWFENWSRDGQPSRGRVHHVGPYPPSPEAEADDIAVSGYAITGEDPAPAAGYAEPSALARTAFAEEPRRYVPTGHSLVATMAAPATFARPDAPEPGWYPSPTSTDHQQWWDGSAWTAERRPVSTRRRVLGRFARR